MRISAPWPLPLPSCVTLLRKGVKGGKLGRPREYDERTASALLEAAERIVDEEGLDALSVRRVANAVEVTTRAVYSLFGSKDALVVALVFRRFALEHPALLRIGVLHEGMSVELADQFRGASDRAFEGLQRRLVRLADTEQLGSRGVGEAACEFDALCEGLVALELRGALPPSKAEWVWRDALRALISGWCAT